MKPPRMKSSLEGMRRQEAHRKAALGLRVDRSARAARCARRIPRRTFLQLAACASALPAAEAWGQAYPSRPVRVIVPVAPGGANDVTARLIGQWLSERLGQQFVIENRAGAATNVGTEAAIKSAPDGYTLLIAGSNAAINPSLFKSLTFNFIRDTAPIGSIMRVPQLMQVNPSLPVTSVPEFIAYAKANPGKIAMGSGGNGSPAHVVGEYFKLMTGTDLTHVPYRGAAPAVTDLLGGQIQVAFTELATSLGHVKGGKLRALAVTTAARSEALPDVPALTEFIPGFDASQWIGLVAPKDTPPAIVEMLNREINAALADPRIKARFAELGGVVAPGSPDDFGKLIRAETEKWSKVIRDANIRVD
jgi:tripartite-type tricarboxylate transporter receptor subunit TctC